MRMKTNMTRTVIIVSMLMLGGCTTPDATPDIQEEVRLTETSADMTMASPVLDGAYSTPVMKQMARKSMVASYAGRAPAMVSKPAHELPYNQERYAYTEENGFKTVTASPLSTLAIDVDTASYSNITRMIQDEDRFPPEGAVRVEEMINYFNYDYPQPAVAAQHPFTMTAELGSAPWNPQHQLMLVGLQAKKISKAQLPASNFVVLVDVSGSMQDELPLIKQSLKLLAKGLDSKDRISIVNYATAIGITLEPTKGSDYETIRKAIDSLQSYGGTDGASGIDAAYALAKKDFIEGGNNRILMLTDGDFNVGRTSESEMVSIVEKERENGVYLSIVGFGYGNVNDQTMEQMADKGNGNYSYINDLLDAKKVFASEMTGTLYTLGKDVKFQVEFNPNLVSAYRLIGYENRRLNDEDFNDDKKDAGEIGVGDSVTALYELVPTGIEDNVTKTVDPLEYQRVTKAQNISDVATVKMRYKEPDKERSQLVVHRVPAKEVFSDNLKFASAVSAFGMKLKNSKFQGNISYTDIIALAKSAKGKDTEGYRAGFIKLVEKSELLAQ